MVVRKYALEGKETDALQNYISARVSQDLFLDAVPPLLAGIDQAIGWHSWLYIGDFRKGMTFLLGEEATLSISDDQPQVPGAGLINARIINLIQNSVAQGEPDVAAFTQRCSNAAFGASSPARGDAWPAWGGLRILVH